MAGLRTAPPSPVKCSNAGSAAIGPRSEGLHIRQITDNTGSVRIQALVTVTRVEMIRRQSIFRVTSRPVGVSSSGDRGVEKTADEPGPTQPLVLSELNMRWDLPDHIEECGAAALAAHLRGSHASGCV